MAPSHEERIKTLKLKREAFKLELEAFKNLLDSYEEGTSISYIKIQGEDLENEFTAFCKSQTELDSADESGALLRERVCLKAQYGSCKARARDIIDAATPVHARNASEVDPSYLANSPHSHIYPGESEITLPKINLPTFAGAYEDWPGFSDQFRSTIHENNRIDQCKKLMYLRSCLKNEPAKAIESLGNSASNYLVAWEILERRYNQPAIIVANHLKALFEIPSIQKPVHKDLRYLLSTIEAHYRALQALNQPTGDTLMIHLFMSKVDHETTLKWKEHTRNAAFPKVEDWFSFLHDRCKILEPLGTSSNYIPGPINSQINRNRPFQYKPPTREFKPNVNHVFNTQNITNCNFCKGSHFTQNCDEFVKLSVAARSRLVRERDLCFNCLRRSHSASDCRATTCKKCHKRHHTLLHVDAVNNAPTTSQAPATCLATSNPSQVLLSTAVIDIIDNNGKSHQCRVLLDSCSQSNFLTQKICDKVGLTTESVSTALQGMNQMSTEIKNRTQARIKSRWNNYVNSLSFLVAKQISQKLPCQVILRKNLDIPAGIHLADPKFHEPAEIDGLLGAQIFWDLLCVGQISLKNRTTRLQKTKLGWIVTGELKNTNQSAATICNLTTHTLESDIQKFWNIEECPSQPILSPEEQMCENHYTTHTTRDKKTGRYTVQLPFKENKTKLGESHHIALKRFLALERSLNKNPDIKKQYTNFLQEYDQLGHMTEIKVDEQGGYYLPHHAVTKSDSITTKLRVVFDASARSSSGWSLNDTLLVGPTLQDNLVALTLRFRFHKYVLTADIAKMYRQINLHNNDRKYHKILWRENSNDPIKTFQLNTVTYGTASAPFLAVRTLHQLAQDEGTNHPIGANILRRDFYVDDVLTGSDSIKEAVAIRNDLISLLARGGFELRQWMSNAPELLQELQSQNTNEHVTLSINEAKKILGLYWNARHDTLGYNIKHIESTGKITKRVILSRIAQLFDPLGLVGPIIVQAKIIMQSLWKQQLNWDESVPQDIHTAWIAFQSQLPLIHNISFPRRVISGDHKHIQLHGFCDASEKAYGACIYIRTTHHDNSHFTQLVCSKSRIAPLKTQTLPRLELCAAALLIKLYTIVVKSVNISFQQEVFWSDSMITLHWINTAPHTLKPFVANRISKIQNSSKPSQWRHIPSEHNPADILSRGANPAVFMETNTWFQGPSWINQSEDTWPQHKLQEINIPDKRKVVMLSTTSQPDSHIFDKFSSFSTLTRVIAYCLRFHHNSRNETRHTGPLSTDELKNAQTRIIKTLQHKAFSNERDALSKNNDYNKAVRIKALCPFIDQDGLIRVGGRLAHSQLPYQTKHQLLIPQDHHITRLIIREAHVKHGHSGVQGTLHAVRQKYWPINGKTSVKSVIQKCITCHKLKPISLDYPMGQFPKNRVTVNRPFLIAGVDYCGPIHIKERKHRNLKKIKVYIAVFVCFSTKAVHIELVSDLTSDAFLAALRRFFARRGKSSDIYSDNATNFLGADRELRETLRTILAETQDSPIHNYLLSQNTRWHFIPPRSPHFGGLWEAAVKSLKHHLNRIVRNTLLTFEELNTHLTEIEAILNSRPLTQLSSDPNDLTPLTPGHFLIGDSLTSTPEYDFTSSKVGRLSSWQHLQQMRQHFWNRWHKEYLNEITVRKKWHEKDVIKIAEGMLVILKEDNTPPLCWPMGRVVTIHPGEDGIVRVVTVKTTNGQYKRSVKKIAPLPLDTT
ncbi:hypothetical protein ANTQUA_LOCUS9005 [Anthophora quadrimaculata]